MFSLKNVLTVAVLAVAGVSASSRSTHVERGVDSHGAYQGLARRSRLAKRDANASKAEQILLNLQAEVNTLATNIKATVAQTNAANGAVNGVIIAADLNALNQALQASITLTAQIPTSPTASGGGNGVTCDTVAQLLAEILETVGEAISAIEGLTGTLVTLQAVLTPLVLQTEALLATLVGQLSIILNCLLAVLRQVLAPVLGQLGSLGTLLSTILGI